MAWAGIWNSTYTSCLPMTYWYICSRISKGSVNSKGSLAGMFSCCWDDAKETDGFESGRRTLWVSFDRNMEVRREVDGFAIVPNPAEADFDRFPLLAICWASDFKLNGLSMAKPIVGSSAWSSVGIKLNTPSCQDFLCLNIPSHLRHRKPLVASIRRKF